MLIEISVNVHEMMKLNYVILFLGKGGMLQNISFWEGTFVPTYWRTQGSKPLDRAYGPVQSFEYAAEWFRGLRALHFAITSWFTSLSGGHLYQLTDARKALNLWAGPTALSWALSTLLKGLEDCLHCSVLLLLDSLLWEGTFVPTYWRTQGSKPPDRAYGPVQSFEYAAEWFRGLRALHCAITAWFTSLRGDICTNLLTHARL